MDLLVGTTNPGKLREYNVMLATLPLNVLSLRDVGLDALDVDETADTFAGNAEHKAQVYAQASGLYALADDSGLSVDALGGKPGVYSHRYAGPDANDEDRYRKLLGELEAVPDEARTARFVCVIALANPLTLDTVTTTGTVEGRIARAPGDHLGGFGYDPVFIPDGYEAVFSALPMEVKNSLSHRGNALRQMLPILQQIAQDRGE
jgi:XTP/dITP diphosphohydrolase